MCGRLQGGSSLAIGRQGCAWFGGRTPGPVLGAPCSQQNGAGAPVADRLTVPTEKGPGRPWTRPPQPPTPAGARGEAGGVLGAGGAAGAAAPPGAGGGGGGATG